MPRTAPFLARWVWMAVLRTCMPASMSASVAHRELDMLKSSRSAL